MPSAQKDVACTVALARLQERGQFTVPARVREAVGMRPGDQLLVRALGPGRFEVMAVPRRPLTDFFKGPKAKVPDIARLRADMGQDLAREYLARRTPASSEVAAARES